MTRAEFIATTAAQMLAAIYASDSADAQKLRCNMHPENELLDLAIQLADAIEASGECPWISRSEPLDFGCEDPQCPGKHKHTLSA